MIASLRGKIIDIALGSAVIECHGVGYEVIATPDTLSRLVRGEEAFLRTQMVVREDAQILYGFDDQESKEMFSVLQTVSGLGPRLAIAALSVYRPEALATAISGSDAKALQKIPGVGKRMAERMIVDLKDKMAGFAAAAPEAAPQAAPSSGTTQQVIEALTGLGFSEKAALPVVEAVAAENPEAGTSALLRQALNRLGKN